MEVEALTDSTGEPGDRRLELCLEAIAAAHKLKTLGQRAGLVTAGGGGIWGLMRSLDQNGPMTVPAIARSRPVARQHIQTLANQLVGTGHAEFIDNPAHKRSKLLRLTRAGKVEYRRLDTLARKLVGEVLPEFEDAGLEAGIATLRRLNGALDLALDGESITES